MPMLTVKLTDEEMAALRALAAGRPMSDLVRDWIRGGQVVYTPVEEPGTLGLDTSGGRPVDTVDTSTSKSRPSFLAAPDDDCASCGHDRQFYHLGGKCSFPTGPRSRCGCPAFVDPSEPF